MTKDEILAQLRQVGDALNCIATTAQAASQHEPEQFCEYAYDQASTALTTLPALLAAVDGMCQPVQQSRIDYVIKAAVARLRSVDADLRNNGWKIDDNSTREKIKNTVKELISMSTLPGEHETPTPEITAGGEGRADCVDGWLIPESCMSTISKETFQRMMKIISRGGSVDVVARCDGKDYRWECDGLKYAKRSTLSPQADVHVGQPEPIDLSTVEGIKRVMGGDMPIITRREDGSARCDIPWIKRFHEETGCGLIEAKKANELLIRPAPEAVPDAEIIKVAADATEGSHCKSDGRSTFEQDAMEALSALRNHFNVSITRKGE